MNAAEPSVDGRDERDKRVRRLILLAQGGDVEAKETLVRENMGLVWSIARKFARAGTEADDLFQIGSIGLIKCVDKFDMNYGVKFSTYAVPMIMGEIRRFLRDDGLIKVARPLKETAKKVKRVYEELSQRSGKSPTINEIAAELGLTAEDVVTALDADRDVESLYSTVNGDGGAYLIDRIETAAGAEDESVDKIALKEAIGRLGERERQVIMLRYFQDRTQADVARIIGVSQVQVSRIEKKAIQTVREHMA